EVLAAFSSSSFWRGNSCCFRKWATCLSIAAFHFSAFFALAFRSSMRRSSSPHFASTFFLYFSFFCLAYFLAVCSSFLLSRVTSSAVTWVFDVSLLVLQAANRKRDTGMARAVAICAAPTLAALIFAREGITSSNVDQLL